MTPVGPASGELPVSTARSLLRDLPIIIGGMALLLGLLRLYRAIPVERRSPGASE